MRRFFMLVVVVFAIGISACGVAASTPTTVTPAPVVTPTAPAPTTTAAPLGFVGFVDAHAPAFQVLPTAQVQHLGNLICSAFTNGATVTQVITAIAQPGISNNAVATILAASAAYLCPQYLPRVDAWASS